MSQTLVKSGFLIEAPEVVANIEAALMAAQNAVDEAQDEGREPDVKFTIPNRLEDRGYFFEVDLDYPDELHSAHSDYPLAPERLNVAAESKSLIQQALEQRYERRPQNYSKLVPNLHDKRTYRLHYENLLYYMQQGMRLVKIHRAVSFTQEAWLEPYIRL